MVSVAVASEQQLEGEVTDSLLKYIELDGKAPKHTLDTFSTDHKNYHDAAILLNTDIVLVDFDKFTDISELIYQKYPTLRVHTSRGYHLYYRKPKGVVIKNWIQRLTNAGVTVDYKTGSKSLSVVKQNGQMRPMDHGELMGDWDRLPDLPFELYPHRLKQLLHGLNDGDGRNSYMYSHLLTMREIYPKKADTKTISDVAHFINDNVLGDPLKEIDTVVDSAMSKKVDEKSSWLDPKDMVITSNYLVKELDIHYFRGRLFFKKDNHYVSDDNLLLRRIDQIIQLKPTHHKQLIDLFKIKATLQEDDELPVQFRNGYTLYENELVQIDPGFTPFYLDVDYNEDAYDEQVDQFLDFFTCHRNDLRQVIEEILGHIIMTRGFPHRAFFFWGESGDNGKSTLIKMMQSFAEGLHTNVPLDKFDDDTSVYSLVGKLLNVADDIDASYLEKSSNFKTIVSGDPVMIRPIYSPAMTLNNKATLIFTCNEIPVFKDKSGGIRKRIRVIPCDAKVTKRDVDIDAKLSTDSAKSYLLRLAIEGLERLIANGDITHSDAIQEITKQYFIQSDSVMNYLDQYDIEGKAQKNVYVQYTAFCEEQGLKAVGSTEFGRRVKKEGYERVQVRRNDKRIWIYQLKMSPDKSSDGEVI